jgi:delta-aminolevulinic acid dehydratase/porphobilinogen synthase
MTTAEAMARAAYPAPSDIVEGALNVFRANLLERDQLPGGLMSSGALRYFFQFYGPAMAARQVRDGIPGSAQGWGDYSWNAVQAAMAIYNRDQKPTEPTQPGTGGTLRGPISVSGRDFVTPDA